MLINAAPVEKVDSIQKTENDFLSTKMHKLLLPIL